MKNRAKGDGKRRIVQVAISLFKNNGYSSTSIGNLAKEAALSKASLYHYIKAKEDLLHLVAGEVLLPFQEKLSQFSLQLETFLITMRNFYLIEENGKLILNLLSDVCDKNFKIRLLFEDFFNDILSCLFKIFLMIESRHNALWLAHKAIFLLHGALLHSRFKKDTEPFDKAIETILLEYHTLAQLKQMPL